MEFSWTTLLVVIGIWFLLAFYFCYCFVLCRKAWPFKPGWFERTTELMFPEPTSDELEELQRNGLVPVPAKQPDIEITINRGDSSVV